MSGQVRQSNNLRPKIEEAVRLGIKNILIPKSKYDVQTDFENIIKIKEISNIREAVDYALMQQAKKN